MRQILKLVPELERLRLSSIDQVEADEQLLRAIAEEERLMPHLHLSMQAGDDMILKRMKRRHTRDDAVTFCAKVKRLRPDTVFGADLIAGFPTETDEMFENSLSVVDDCDLTYLHVFPFSPRQGTPAARMPQVERAVVKERAAQLRDKGAKALTRFLDGHSGNEVELLVEKGSIGRTRQFAEMRVPAAVPARRHGARARQRPRRRASRRRGDGVSGKGAFSRLWGGKSDAEPATTAELADAPPAPGDGC